MGFLKFLVWTGCAVGLGVFLATGSIEGRTPLDYAQRAWKRHVQPSEVDRQVDRVKDGVRDVLDEARDAVNKTTKQAPAAPRERITNEDRAEINRIIAQKK
ncbi:hypothetical protein [Vitiosangium sp. GDMCC 1.1324]|uniref:hypothetical protein n=1 Tax=Vitiosangium sp. (strain GDMCC 1.1324) TaxID=2138576 RepID=UPI000D3ABF9E|nr:hypothetical protein [Vitiosangium sp. GDMCC 1.1324]PTL77910.1 hypothetical protein DAT35_42700 [Vitiosangium sp. GDMCC 1.1324]